MLVYGIEGKLSRKKLSLFNYLSLFISLKVPRHLNILFFVLFPKKHFSCHYVGKKNCQPIILFVILVTQGKVYGQILHGKGKKRREKKTIRNDPIKR